MKNWIVLAGFSGVVGLVACGGDDPPAFVGSGGTASQGGKNAKGGTNPTLGGEGGDDGGSKGGSFTPAGGKAGSGGKAGGLGGAGGDDGGAGPVPGGAGGAGGAGGEETGTPPTVAILSPEVVTDPLGGKVLVSDNVDVTCKAVAGEGPDASPVDPNSVKIAVLDAAGEVVISEKTALLTANADEYAVAVPLTAVTSGKVVLRCSARSTTAALGQATLDTLADRGPKLTLTAPVKDFNLALKEPAKFTFTAVPQPLAPTGDTQADVASVELKINGVTVATAPVNGSPNTYEATVDLNGAQFTTKPNGSTAVALSATNKRAPKAASTALASTVIVDGAGPVIKVTAPTSAAIAGGIVTVSFTVTDAISGVNPDSIVVSFDTKSDQFKVSNAWGHISGTDTYTFKFDSRAEFPTSKYQIPIKVTAQDIVGNSTSSVSIPVYLDNVGPQVDLDPRPLRTKAANGDCSGAFDPLGDAVNDQQITNGVQLLRAFVWDKTNEPGSNVPLHFAGVAPGSVRVLFRNPNDPKALLVNTVTSGTGTCNDVQYTTDDFEFINLSALTPGGTTPYTGEKLAAPVGSCTVFPSSGAPPKLCNGDSALSIVVGHNEYDLAEQAVYGYSPVSGSACTGQAWDFGSLVDADGFVCFAATATDTKGNVGISPPLRLCVDVNDAAHPGAPACATMSVALPTCTDGCTPPARGGGMVISLD